MALSRFIMVVVGKCRVSLGYSARVAWHNTPTQLTIFHWTYSQQRIQIKGQWIRTLDSKQTNIDNAAGGGNFLNCFLKKPYILLPDCCQVQFRVLFFFLQKLRIYKTYRNHCCNSSTAEGSIAFPALSHQTDVCIWAEQPLKAYYLLTFAKEPLLRYWWSALD